MEITVDLVEYVAKLSRLNVDPDELPQFASQLADIVAYIDKLEELDTDGVEPLTNVSGLTNVLRPDNPRPSLARDDALKNSPQQTGGCYRVPRVVQ